MAETPRATYAAAGVDIDAGEEVVERIKGSVASTRRPGVLGGIGGFGGLFELDLERYPHPILVSATDGIGTKLEVARLAGRFDTVGIDAVAMCVDDLVCIGAEPLYFLDYVAVGRVVPERIEAVVAGLAEGCRQARCALLGGETAEHPGVMGEDDIDVAGFAVGVVEKGTELGAERIRVGDVVLGLGSPGLRSNGYTLARHVLFDVAGKRLDDPAWEGAEVSVADELLRPSVIYAPAVLDAAWANPGALHGVAHITGGGLRGNVVRVLGDDHHVVIERSNLDVPRIFEEIQRLGNVDDAEMERVFNLGIGMTLFVAEGREHEMIASLRGSGIDAAVIGRVEPGTKDVEYR
jgi:phosphoribosylformylglycinamidine cyclo-ligase